MSARSNNSDRVLAEALDSLAGLVDTGMPVRAALRAWAQQDSNGASGFGRLRSFLDLGAPLGAAIELVARENDDFAELGRFLAPMLRFHETKGGNLAGAVRGLAVSFRDRAASIEEARASAAGAKISGRVVASLPLAFLPFAPLGRAPVFDPLGILMLSIGVVLAICGMRWIDRLTPRPPVLMDDVERFIRSTVLLLRAGVPLKKALDEAAEAADLDSARDRVSLGCSWGAVLEGCVEPTFSRMGSIVSRGERLGVPVADALEDLADRRTQSRLRGFQARTRRAPVLMMVPLTLCVLPAFGLLALGPFLRGLALA